jgi:hypothetical protein
MLPGTWLAAELYHLIGRPADARLRGGRPVAHPAELRWRPPPHAGGRIRFGDQARVASPPCV